MRFTPPSSFKELEAVLCAMGVFLPLHTKKKVQDLHDVPRGIESILKAKGLVLLLIRSLTDVLLDVCCFVHPLYVTILELQGPFFGDMFCSFP